MDVKGSLWNQLFQLKNVIVMNLPVGFFFFYIYDFVIEHGKNPATSYNYKITYYKSICFIYK